MGLINKLLTNSNISTNQNKNYITYIILVLSPIVLVNDLLFLKNELILVSIKLLIFMLSVLLIPIKSLINSKIGLISLIFSLYIVGITIVFRTQNDILYSILYVLPFLLVINYKVYDIFSKKIVYFFLSIYILSFIYILVMPKEYIAGKTVFAYLVNGPHTSTYSILIFYFLFFYFYKNNFISKYLFIFVTLITLYIMLGYQARNAQLGLVLFFLTYYFYKSRYSKSLRNSIIFICFVLFILFIFIINGFYNINWNIVSSGRIFSWSERIEILSNYDFSTLFWGKGYGADIMTTKQWWWDEKPSHNDFLSLVFNSGLVSLFLIISILTYLFKKANSFQKAILVFIIITSFTNTGYLGRPIQFLYIVIIFIISNNFQVEKNDK